MGLIAVTLGGIPVYAYGLVVLSAVLPGLLVAWGNVRLHGEEFWRVEDMFLWGVPLSLLGGRIAYVFCHWGEFGAAPLSVFCIWQGGLSFYGGMLTFFFVVFAYSQIHGLDGWRWMDLLTPAFLLAVAVHGIGMFALQMNVGTPSSADPFGNRLLTEYVAFYFRPLDFQEEEYQRPIALFQAGLQFAVFLAVCFLAFWQRERRFPWPNGCVALLGVGLVALIRFACGSFYLFGFDELLLPGRILSGGAAFLCLALFAFRVRRRDFYGI